MAKAAVRMVVKMVRDASGLPAASADFMDSKRVLKRLSSRQKPSVGVGAVDGLLELEGVQADNDVVDGVLAELDDHESSERFQEVGLVNTIDALAAKGFFNLRMLGDVTDTENPGQDSRADLLAVVNTVVGHRV